MLHSFRLTRGSRGVKYECRFVCLHWFWRNISVWLDLCKCFMIPDVSSLLHWNLLSSSFYNYNFFNGWRVDYCMVCSVLQCHGFPSSVSPICCHKDFCLAVIDSVSECFCAEA